MRIAQLTAALLLLAPIAQAQPPSLGDCQTVPACVARARHAADPGDGITDAENQVAKRLHALSPQAIPAVVELLDDPNPNVRELAGYILRDMPGLGPEHLAALQRAVQAGDGWLPPAIASIGTPEAIRFLVAELRKEPETDTQLAYAFERLGPAAFPELLELFRCRASCDDALLDVVGSIFSTAGEKASELVEPLLAVVADDRGPLAARRSAAGALGKLGARARPAVKELVLLSRGGPSALQAAAQKALLSIGGPGTKEILESSLEGDNVQFGLRDIAALGDGARETGARVEALLVSGDPDVRVAAARTLGLIGYRRSCPALAAALAEPADWRLTYVAAEALGRLGAAEAHEALLATSSDHWYPPVRQAARMALGALDDASHYARSSHQEAIAEFFRFERSAAATDPCATTAQFPAMPTGPETLDPKRQPALARRLAYDREIGFVDERGPRSVRKRTIPEVGLRIKGGWLVGVDQGEWGGELVLKSDVRGTTKVLGKNVSGLHRLTDGGIVAVTGLAHLVLDDGALYKVTCASSECSASWWRQLPGAPRSSWLIETGELLVNTTGGSVLVSVDGTMRMAACHNRSGPTTK